MKEPSGSVKAMLTEFENKTPEIVFHWTDSQSEAEGWVVINSLKGGAAGGGTRMRSGLGLNEVVSLAKTMEIKFSVAGPAIGGAKSGINFDPTDPRKTEVLQRWFHAVSPILKAYYGTGGDLNVDEAREVAPITEQYGLWHPQEGVVNGHFAANQAARIQKIGNLRRGIKSGLEDASLSPDLSGGYSVSDMITGWGVAESVRHFYDLFGGDLPGKRVIVQGWGNVAASAAFYLASRGARIVGIQDVHGGLLEPQGFSTETIRQLFLSKKGNRLSSDNLLPPDIIAEKIWTVGAEVFLPCAASRLLEQAQVDAMQASGLELISCGANVPFNDPDVFFGPIHQAADSKLSVVPDFIANCGMARAFAFLMGDTPSCRDVDIFEDVSKTIRNALSDCQKRMTGRAGLTETAYRIALDQGSES